MTVTQYFATHPGLAITRRIRGDPAVTVILGSQKLFELVGVSWLRRGGLELLAGFGANPASESSHDCAGFKPTAIAITQQQAPDQRPETESHATMIDRLLTVIRQRNYSIRTEEAYRSWTE